MEASTNSENFIAKTAVRALVQKGVKLLALDFDKTIVDIHTAGAWRGPSCNLVPHVRSCFRALIDAALAEPLLHVCVVTFSTQSGMIEDVLKAALPNCDIGRILIRGPSRDWAPDGGCDSLSFASFFLGKEEHLARVMTDLYNMRHAIIHSHEILLVDDDVDNIAVAQRFGHLAFEVKDEVTISDILAFVESLRRDETSLPPGVTVKQSDGAASLQLPDSAVSDEAGLHHIESESLPKCQRRRVSLHIVPDATQQSSVPSQRNHSVQLVVVNGSYHAI